MDRARAPFFDRPEMLRRGVAFVLLKAILRPSAIELFHHPVARHLGQNRGGGDRNRSASPLPQSPEKESGIWNLIAVDQEIIGFGPLSAFTAFLMARKVACKIFSESIVVDVEMPMP